ncbi:AbrB family transcriptional regulator [Pelagibacterales bacterium SAG-MED17]|nr:AbrB family transcriptional regulator [Pelagibacterales bacterium SAG-MED17]
MLNIIPFKRLLNELSISYKALIIGVIGGYIGTLIGLPLPWLLGALGLNLCIAFTNFKIEFSTKLLNPVFLMVGIILGGTLNVSLLYKIHLWIFSSMAMIVCTIVSTILAGHYFLFKKEKTVPAKQNFLKGAICSSIAGFSSFCVHAGGTPTSLYLLPLRLKKEIYVGTRIIFFSCVNLIKLPLYIYLSMMNFDTLFQSISLFPLALIGIFIGYKLLKIIEDNLFYNIIYGLILVSSTKLIFDFI